MIIFFWILCSKKFILNTLNPYVHCILIFKIQLVDREWKNVGLCSAQTTEIHNMNISNDTQKIWNYLKFMSHSDTFYTVRFKIAFWMSLGLLLDFFCSILKFFDGASELKNWKFTRSFNFIDSNELSEVTIQCGLVGRV